jgi:FtsP/CotA-like multicopper oxidase with cupredoxin domain
VLELGLHAAGDNSDPDSRYSSSNNWGGGWSYGGGSDWGGGATGTNLARKDVVRLSSRGDINLFFRFRDWLGRYPTHCHNIIHEDHAMMLRFDIAVKGDTNSRP